LKIRPLAGFYLKILNDNPDEIEYLFDLYHLFSTSLVKHLFLYWNEIKVNKYINKK